MVKVVQMGNGRKPDAGRYYNRPSLNEALAELEELWPTLRRGDKIDVKIFSESKEIPLWVHDETGGRIGVRPMILALLLMYRYENRDLVKQEVVAKIKDVDLDWMTELENSTSWEKPPSKAEHKSIREMLRELLKSAEKNTPSYVQNFDRWCFIVTATRALKALYERTKQSPQDWQSLAEDAASFYDELIVDRLQTATDVFNRIKARWLTDLSYYEPAVITEAPMRLKNHTHHVLHFIPQKYSDYLRPNGRFCTHENPDMMRRNASRIIKHTANPNASSRIVLLTGNQNAGKSGCLVEVIRNLHETAPDGATIALKLGNDTGNEEILPVCLLNVPDYNNQDLVKQILTFLRQLDHSRRTGAAPSHNNQALTGFDSNVTLQGNVDILETLYGEIRELHAENPAFFILTNWEDLNWMTPRAQLRDQCRPSLISWLHESNRNSRMVISTTKPPSKGAERRLPKYFPVHLTDPLLEDVTRYFPEMEYPAIYRKVMTKAERKLGRGTVPGDVLILLATVMQLCEGDAASESLVKKAIRDISKARKIDPYSEQAATLVRILIERLNTRDMFRITMAVAASDDGMRPSTLVQLLKDWDRATRRKLARPTETVRESLKEMEGIARGFFLTPKTGRPFARNQYRPHEQPDSSEMIWEMHESLRQLIMNTLSNPIHFDWAHDYNVVLREASGQVAKVAHYRAQEGRIQTALCNQAPQWRDMLRDVQAFEALLASIDPDQLIDSKHNRAQISEYPLLHNSINAVFAAGENQSPAVALRFAAQCMLQELLDKDGMMSMFWDQDQMRAHLYWLLFMPTGQRYFRSIDELKKVDLPKGLQPYLHDVFTPEQIMDLLEALAISALHAQSHKIVHWAWRTALAMIDELEPVRPRSLPSQKRTALMNRAIRILCSAVDISILRGKPLSRSRPRADDGLFGNSLTLLRLRERAKREYPNFVGIGANEPPTVLGLSESADDNLIESIKAWLRLRSREAELVALTQSLEGAVAILEEIYLVEETLARNSRNGVGTVVSGRPARAALKLMLRADSHFRDAGDRKGARWKRANARINGMLHANSSRLSRYGAAEQVSVLLDWSRYHYVRSDLSQSMYYAQKARRECKEGQISYGIQMQALSHFVAMVIEAHKAGESESFDDALRWGFGNGADLLHMAEQDADAVFQTAKAVGYQPTQGIALYLRTTVRFLLVEEGVFSNALDHAECLVTDISDARRIMTKCNDQSFCDDMKMVENAANSLLIKATNRNMEAFD